MSSPEEVLARVLAEIEQSPERAAPPAGPHGLGVRGSLVVPPQLRTYRDSLRDDELTSMWLVLQEQPDGSGYSIVFDEQAELFGLAIGAPPDATFIGYHGSFLDTVEGM